MKTTKLSKEKVLAKIIDGGFNPIDAQEMVEKYYDRAIESGFTSLVQILRYITC